MSESNKILYIFRDHFKKSSDWFRHALGLYFDFGTRLSVTSDPVKPILQGSRWELGTPILIDSDKNLYKQVIKLKFADTDKVAQYLRSGFSPDNSDNIIGTVEDIIKQTLSNSNKIYRDINSKLFKTVKRESESSSSSLWHDYTSLYNFYVNKYEELIQNDVVPEEVLPNFYVFSLALDKSILNSVLQRDYDSSQVAGFESPYDMFMNKFDKFITLDNNIFLNRDSQVSWVLAIVLVGYIEQYANVYDNVSIDFIETMRKRFSNIFSDITNQEIINKLNQFKNSYPMFIELLFSVPKNNSFLKFLNQTHISTEFLTSFINEKLLLENNQKGAEFSDFESFDIIETYKTEITHKKQDLFINDIETLIKEHIYKIIEDNLTISLDQQITAPITFLDGTTDNVETTITVDTFVGIITAQARLNELLKSQIRTYKQLLAGQFAKSEILYFRIQKSDSNDNIIQHFYLPNIPDVNVQNFVDTQVKYNKEYKYKIFAGNVIYGTEYYYRANYLEPYPQPNDPDFPDESGPITSGPYEFDDFGFTEGLKPIDPRFSRRRQN